MNHIVFLLEKDESKETTNTGRIQKQIGKAR
jgi:hypothetical protein